MRNKNMIQILFTGLLMSLIAMQFCCGKENGTASNNATKTTEPENRKGIAESVQPNIVGQGEQQATEARQKIMQDALSAVQETRNALLALDSNNTNHALAALERATGRLELILARDPNLALAPVDMRVITHDLLSTLEAIDDAKKEAQKALKNNEIQTARRLIGELGSEIIIRVSNIPLATYPGAIKAVVPLIDNGKKDEAMAGLQAALNTLVITDHIIPLPLVRTQEILKKSETLVEKPKRTKEQNDSLALLLDNAKYQLNMAEALGYGNKKEYKPFYEQISKIEEKTKGGKSGHGYFDTLYQSIRELKTRIFK